MAGVSRGPGSHRCVPARLAEDCSLFNILILISCCAAAGRAPQKALTPLDSFSGVSLL